MWVCISDCSTWSRNYRQLLKALRVCWSSAIAPAFNLSNTFKGSGELTRLSEKTLLPECSQQTAALTKEGLWQPSLTVTSTTASSPTPQLLEGLSRYPPLLLQSLWTPRHLQLFLLVPILHWHTHIFPSIFCSPLSVTVYCKYGVCVNMHTRVHIQLWGVNSFLFRYWFQKSNSGHQACEFKHWSTSPALTSISFFVG